MDIKVSFLILLLIKCTFIAPEMSYEEKLEAVTLGKPGSDYCYHDHQIPLELVFLIDRSSQEMIKKMPKIIEIVDTLKVEYPGSKFGMTFFADFSCQDWYGPKWKCKDLKVDGGFPHHEDPEGCYTFKTKLSEDTDILKSNVEDGAIEFLPSGGTESGIAGIFMTASDPNIGWTVNPDPGAEVNKIIVVITDDIANCCKKNYGTKNPPKGDGTDKCETMNNPTLEVTSKKLKEINISLFMIVWWDIIPDWEKQATEMGIDHKATKATKSNEVTLTKLNELILDLTIKRGHITCEDPEGYNTLGL